MYQIDAPMSCYPKNNIFLFLYKPDKTQSLLIHIELIAEKAHLDLLIL